MSDKEIAALGLVKSEDGANYIETDGRLFRRLKEEDEVRGLMIECYRSRASVDRWLVPSLASNVVIAVASVTALITWWLR